MAYSEGMRFHVRRPRGIRGVKQVVVHLQGGIGNQLFQSSVGFFLANQFDLDLKVDSTSAAFHDEFNPVDITQYEIFEKVSRSTNPIRNFSSKLVLRLARLILKVDPALLQMNSLGEFDHVFRTIRSLHISGYFADFTYADKAGFTKLNFKMQEESLWLQEMTRKIGQEPTVAVHVRRGDFLINPSHYGILSVKYYSEALNMLPGELKDARLWIFSDNPSLAREDLATISRKNIEFIRPAENSNALESLKLMSRAQGIIAANSTFSLWAAYFNSQATYVAYPAKDKQGRILAAGIPSEWVGISGVWK